MLIRCSQRFTATYESADMTILASARFYSYSRRVQRLVRSTPAPKSASDKTSQRSVSYEVLSAWQKAGALLFPALRHVHVRLPGTEAVPMLRFVSPSVTSVFIDVSPEADGEPLPEDLLERSRELVHFVSTFTKCDSSVFQSITTQMLADAPRLETIVAPGTSTQDMLIRLVSYPHLRRITAQGNLDDRIQDLPSECFQNVEVADLTDQGPESAFVHAFLARAFPTLVQDLALDLSQGSFISTFKLEDIMERASRFTLLTHISIRVHLSGALDEYEDAQMDSMHGILALLAPLRRLTTLRIHLNQYMTLPEPQHLELFAHWPCLEVLGLTSSVIDPESGKSVHSNLSLSLSAFFDILLACPHLTQLRGTPDCDILPSEDVIAQLERLQHPFRGDEEDFAVFHWRVEPDTQGSAVRAALNRATPHSQLWHSLW
jgi:hypothetical protein